MGPFEGILIIVISIVSLLPAVAAIVFLWLVFKGRFSAPKQVCPKCGADLRER